MNNPTAFLVAASHSGLTSPATDPAVRERFIVLGALALVSALIFAIVVIIRHRHPPHHHTHYHLHEGTGATAPPQPEGKRRK
jgi:hypothetical protein